MHWAEANVNSMLAIRNLLCSARWREDWPKIEARLRLLARQRRQQIHRKHHPHPPTSRIARALQGDFDPGPSEPSSQPSFSPAPRKNPWRNFKHGKALFQRPAPPKI